MQNMILLLFAVFFTAGSYFILAEVFKVPTYRTSRAILTVGKKQKKQARSSDAFIMELSGKSPAFCPWMSTKSGNWRQRFVPQKFQ